MKKNLAAYLFISIILSIVFISCQEVGPKVDEKIASEHIIKLDAADAMIKSFGEVRTQLIDSSDITSPDRINAESFPISEEFNRHAIQLLLNQTGAEGVRIYLGKDEKGLVRLILLPVDAQGNDIRRKLTSGGATRDVQAASSFAPPDDGEAVEMGNRCPDDCPN